MKPRASTRSAFVLAVMALICCTAASALASQSLSKLTLIDDDPSSVFRLSRAWGQEPYQNADVQFFIHSDSLITQFGIELRWEATELSYVSVAAGSGLPAGTTVTPNPSPGALGVLCTLPAGGAQLSSEVPLLVLTYEPECFGFGQTADVSFHEDAGSNNDNFFNAGGISYSPSTIDGGVNLQTNWQYVQGESVQALPMQSEVAWNLNYQNTVSARVTDIEVTYDDTRLSVVDVLAGPDTPTALVSHTAVDGVLNVTIDGDYLTAGSYDFLTVVFALDAPDDDYTTALAFGAGCGGETPCGPTSINAINPGGITVPDFVAAATVHNVNVTRTASWFLVPVSIDANMPVHGYSLYLDYPPDPPGDITYMGLQDTGVQLPGVLYNLEQGRLYFQLNDRPAAYFDAGPQTVFKIKFGLAPNQPAGTEHHVYFATDATTSVRHRAADATIHSALVPATLDTLGSTITLVNPPVTCPALSVWDGEGFRLENNVLAACDGVKPTQDVVDHYLVRGPVQDEKGAVRVRLTEDAQVVTSFRDLALVAVDHPADERIQIGSQGEILTLDHSIALRQARDHRGRDVTAELLAPDEIAYRSDEPGWLELDFGPLSRHKGEGTAQLAGIGNPPPKEIDRLTKTDGQTNRLRVLVRDATGAWMPAAEFGPRARATEEAAVFGTSGLAAGDDLVLRLEWDQTYAIDVFELARTRPLNGVATALPKLSMQHSVEGDLLGKVRDSVLAPGQAIDLRFDVSGLPALEDGQVREYVFRAEGHYDGSAPVERPSFAFQLGDASPNPFNPSTEISYSVRQEGPVHLVIHDVRGQRVRTLVSEAQAPGNYSVHWNGRDDRNRPVASGVYFYVLEAGAERASRKMVLMK